MPVLQQAVSLSIDNVLLATDFSLASEKAGVYAKAVARRFGSKLEIANVFNPAVVTSYEEAIVQMTASDRKEISEENLACFARNLSLAGIPTELVSTEDHSPSKALLEIASEHGADLIVAGTEAKTGLSRLILGSTAEEILRRANCPVLTVGPRVKTPENGQLEFRTIIFATDFSTEAAKAAVYAFSFAEDSAAHLYCCCVLSLSDEGLKTRQELDERFKQKLHDMIPEDTYDWCTPECVVRYGEAATSILELAERVHADLIVLGARRPSFWLTRVEGGLTPALLAESKCPVLTVS